MSATTPPSRSPTGRPRSGARPAPAPLADAHGPIVYTIYRISLKNRTVVGNLLRPLGLFPGQDILLMQLWEREGRSQAYLVEALGVDHSTVTKMLQRLEAAGLVVRRPSSQDRRMMLVSLTDAGRRLRGEIERTWQELERLTTAHLTDREREQLLHLLQSVEAHVRPAGAPDDEAPSTARS
jgi:MarR family transcriptional regulator, organic hydroperoxide resistance regulator